MAVTDERFDPADLDGHTMPQLIEYLDRERSPRDETIESSPGCRLALAALEQLRRAAATYLADDPVPAPAEHLLPGILARIDLEVRAGRAIPLPAPGPEARLAVTQGAVRGLVRAAGDAVGGVLVGRVALLGDLGAPDARVRVAVEVAVPHGSSIPLVTDRLRGAIRASLGRHTALTVTAVDITVGNLLDLPGADT